MRDSTSKPWRTSEGTQVGEGHWMGEHDRERLICLLKAITHVEWAWINTCRYLEECQFGLCYFYSGKELVQIVQTLMFKSFVSNSLPLTLILFIFLCGSSSGVHHCSGVRSEEEKLCSCASAVTKAAPELVIFLAREVHETSTPTPSTVGGVPEEAVRLFLLCLHAAWAAPCGFQSPTSPAWQVSISHQTAFHCQLIQTPTSITAISHI